MPTTSRAGLPFPDGEDPVDIPGDVGALASRVADLLGATRVTELQRDALEGNDLYGGRVVFNTDSGVLEVYNGDAGTWDGVSAATLSQLADVDTAGAQAGQALVFDGNEWVPGESAADLGDLGDVDTAGAATGEVLAFDGTGWVADGGYATQADLDALETGLNAETLGLFAETNLRLWQLEADVIGEVEGFVGWHGEAFLDGQDEVASETGDISVSRGARLGDGGASLSTLPDENTPIGEEIAGGFIAGVIYTDANSADIDANDTRQNGKRYALIVSPKAIGEPSSNLQWRTSRTGVAEARTRWDGLYVTDHIIGGNAGSLSSFPIFEFCDQVRTSDPVPDDGGSDWYIPAMDELELLYRNLKPGTEDNDVRERDLEFPDLFQQGENPSSDPQGTAYTASDPQQTTVADFQGSGGAETLQFEGDSDSNRLWSATEADRDRAWYQTFRGSSAGSQLRFDLEKTDTRFRCRLVRRVEL